MDGDDRRIEAEPGRQRIPDLEQVSATEAAGPGQTVGCAAAEVNEVRCGRVGLNDAGPRGIGFRHYTVERFADTMAAIDVAFIGWPGDRDDLTRASLRDVVHDLGRLLVVTLGSRGVQVFDGRSGGSDRWFDVNPVPVEGTTVGCGDAFIAWFLAEFWRTRDLAAAVERGKIGGAMATHWRHPLPDEAYGSDGER